MIYAVIRRNQVKECAMYSNNIAVHRVKCGNKVLHVHGRRPTVSTDGITLLMCLQSQSLTPLKHIEYEY